MLDLLKKGKPEVNVLLVAAGNVVAVTAVGVGSDFEVASSAVLAAASADRSKFAATDLSAVAADLSAAATADVGSSVVEAADLAAAAVDAADAVTNAATIAVVIVAATSRTHDLVVFMTVLGFKHLKKRAIIILIYLLKCM